jgi:hypothetical protein
VEAVRRSALSRWSCGLGGNIENAGPTDGTAGGRPRLATHPMRVGATMEGFRFLAGCRRLRLHSVESVHLGGDTEELFVRILFVLVASQRSLARVVGRLWTRG